MSTLAEAIVATVAGWGAEPEQALKLERHIFGSSNPLHIAGSVEAFCVSVLGAPIAECLFWRSNVGSVSGLLLADGRQVVIKAHPPTVDVGRLIAVRRVQQYLSERGFSCPSLLTGPVPIAHGHAMVEELVDTGVYADAHEPAIRHVLARTLAHLVRITSALGPLPELQPSSMPAAESGALWPIPHNAMFDFVATALGAAWIDDLARSAQQALVHDASTFVIGHTDWRAEHFRFVDGVASVIYDWDSLSYAREAAIVGMAAATFTANWNVPVLLSPSPEETQAFIKEYECARGAPFTVAEQQAILAQVTYTRAYGARCEHSLAPTATSYPPGSLREGLVRHSEALLH